MRENDIGQIEYRLGQIRPVRDAMAKNGMAESSDRLEQIKFKNMDKAVKALEAKLAELTVS